MDGINLLVIGYSALDQEILRLFSESKNRLRRMLVANGVDGARPAAERIADAFHEKDWADAWATGHTFSTLVDTGELRRWMGEVATT
jgi:hypothetical protein